MEEVGKRYWVTWIGVRGGRPKREWIKKIINERNPAGQSEREQILRHQIEVAKPWEVRAIVRRERIEQFTECVR